MTTIFIENIIEKLKNTNFKDFASFLDAEEYTITEDELIDLINTYSSEKEVIYYETAMKYLLDNDPSLMDSLELANDFGYTLKDLNSELLATLLLQDKTKTDLTTLLIK